MIETDRLKLYAASHEQMEAFIAAQSVDVLDESGNYNPPGRT